MIEITYKVGLKFPRIVLRTAIHLVIRESENTKLIKPDLRSLDHCVSLQSRHRNFASSNSFVQVWGTALGHLKSVRQLVVLELSKIVNEDCNTLCPSSLESFNTMFLKADHSV